MIFDEKQLLDYVNDEVKRNVETLNSRITELEVQLKSRQANDEVQQEWYDVKEIAGLIKQRESTARKWIRNGTIKGQKSLDGKRWLVHRDERSKIAKVITEKGLAYWKSYGC